MFVGRMHALRRGMTSSAGNFNLPLSLMRIIPQESRLCLSTRQPGCMRHPRRGTTHHRRGNSTSRYYISPVGIETLLNITACLADDGLRRGT
ncbi:hypothetical protein AVEN_251130-1 [Araneus ventricosus]|uniref:Uncharacterized protein n=1 Tax=Araneus ventricosus TaxID=182803 RepID=A0A4Y2TE94_ARAVE|nr:hypothetical protein AVEN_251130-1 [Araneus ventricosus]